MKKHKGSKTTEDAFAPTPEQTAVAKKFATAYWARDKDDWVLADIACEFNNSHGEPDLETLSAILRQENIAVTGKLLSKWVLTASVFPPGTRIEKVTLDKHHAAATRARATDYRLGVQRPDEEVCETIREIALPFVQAAAKNRLTREQIRRGESKPRPKKTSARAKPPIAPPPSLQTPETEPSETPPAAMTPPSSSVLDVLKLMPKTEKSHVDSEPQEQVVPASEIASMIADTIKAAVSVRDLIQIIDDLRNGFSDGFEWNRIELTADDREKISAKMMALGGLFERVKRESLMVSA